MVVCGAYAIRPYTDDKNLVHFSVRSTIFMVVCGAYSIRPYADDKNLVHFPVRSTICMVICGAYAVASLHERPEKMAILLFLG